MSIARALAGNSVLRTIFFSDATVRHSYSHTGALILSEERPTY
jgi:hypothetical protein